MRIKNEWERAILREISAYSNVDLNNNEESLLTNYITYMRKCTFQPVQVFESEEIKNNFPEQFRESYNDIKQRLTTGLGIQPYLSKAAQRLKPDMLYLHWGILHLHLGKIQKSGIASRTDESLRLRIINNCAYFIEFAKHRKDENGNGGFVDPHELQIIYNNWPSTLCVLRGISLEHSPSQTEVKKLRNAGVNCASEIIGKSGKKLCVFPSMGYSMNKTSIEDLNLLDNRIPFILQNLINIAKQQGIPQTDLDKILINYDAKNHLFTFGLLVIPEIKLHSLFNFNSLDFWRYLFDYIKLPINFTNNLKSN
ncbi:hypothetical protein [Liquorilactobacillus satsumensis]|uniref:hypothetical protein n=1 Tax=Liquorilactobacillus satsumensis TaxID=259059 RepID=UPI0039ECA7A7